MKLLYVFAFTLLFINLSVSQTVDFAPVGAKWWINKVVTEPIPADSFVVAEVLYEEIKNGQLCRVITNLSGYGLPNPAHVFTRNDSVFFYSEVTEQFELLYDFTATAGSNWTVKGLSNYNGWDFVVNVTGVSDVDYNGQILKTWHIPFSEHWGDRIVEKVGSLWYLSPVIPSFPTGYNPHVIRCYEEDGELYSFITFECDYYDDISSVVRYSINSKMSLSPNPSKGNVVLKISPDVEESDLKYSIKTIYGRELQTGQYRHPETNIDLSDIPQGMYLVIIQSNGTAVGAQKLVVK